MYAIGYFSLTQNCWSLYTTGILQLNMKWNKYPHWKSWIDKGRKLYSDQLGPPFIIADIIKIIIYGWHQQNRQFQRLNQSEIDNSCILYILRQGFEFSYLPKFLSYNNVKDSFAPVWQCLIFKNLCFLKIFGKIFWNFDFLRSNFDFMYHNFALFCINHSFLPMLCFPNFLFLLEFRQNAPCCFPNFLFLLESCQNVCRLK